MRDFLEENGFTPVSFFGGLLALALVVSLFAATLYFLAGAISKTNSATVSTSGYAATFRHDGHLLIRATGGGLLHHPDCPCRKVAAAQ